MGCDGRLYLWQKLSEPPPERKGWREVKEISAAQKTKKKSSIFDEFGCDCKSIALLHMVSVDKER